MEEIANLPVTKKQGEKGDGLTRPFSVAGAGKIECPKCHKEVDFLLGSGEAQACETCYVGGPEAPPAGFSSVNDAYQSSKELDV